MLILKVKSGTSSISGGTGGLSAVSFALFKFVAASLVNSLEAAW